jgi:general secretion pathway protein N
MRRSAILLAVALLGLTPSSPFAQETGATLHAAADPLAGLDDRSVLNPLSEITLESLSGFRDRPLFTPARRPPAPPQAEPEPEPDVAAVEPEPEPEPEVEIPAVTLSGVVEIDSDRVAMLRDPSGVSTLSVRVGDPVEAWTVAAIEDASIVLEYEDRRHEIRLFQPGEQGGGAGGAPMSADGMDGSDGEGFIDPETGEFVPDAGLEFDPETGEMRPPGARNRAMAAPPKGVRGNAGDGAEAQPTDDLAAEGAEEIQEDFPLDAATDGDVLDAAEDPAFDPAGEAGYDDGFGQEDFDGDGIPDHEQTPDGG